MTLYVFEFQWATVLQLEYETGTARIARVIHFACFARALPGSRECLAIFRSCFIISSRNVITLLVAHLDQCVDLLTPILPVLGYNRFPHNA